MMKSLRLIAACLAGYGTSLVVAQSSTPPQGAGALPLTPPPFDAASQHVSVEGQYAWAAPTANQERGPCPGLNAMANHGYLPRSGTATIAQFIDACQTVFGMGPDLAAALAAYGAVVDGNGLSWSIGGKPHTGISGSHSNYESDNSPLKGDLFQYGDLQKLIMSQYKQLFNLQPDAATANYNMEVMRTFRSIRFQESIAGNPLFAYAPFSGQLVSNAAHSFIYRFMSNKSAEYPEGVLNQEVLNSFMSIYGSKKKPYWRFGEERIPNNWYKRNAADAYTVEYLLSDIVYMSEKNPQVAGVGCNTGKVNTYNNVSISQLTGGAYTSGSAAANPVCFGLEFIIADLPAITGYSKKKLAPLVTLLQTSTLALNCTPISSVDANALSGCVGLTMYQGPRAKIAPGAVHT